MIHLSMVRQPGCLIIEIFGSTDRGRHLCYLELNGLEGSQGNAKLMPFFDVVARLLQGGPCNPHCHGADVQSCEIEESHQLPEPIPLLTDKVGGRYSHIGK